MMRTLDDTQVAAFNREYVRRWNWDLLRQRIDKDFPGGRFSFLDLGGGSGLLADRLLDTYPQCTGTVLDNSRLLLDKNRCNERKTLVCDTVENMGRLKNKYDLLCLHFVLHHLVGDSYRQSRSNISATLAALPAVLNSGGRISVFENMYKGMLLDGLPSHLVYHLTSARALARIMRRLGANTAGVGVCFLSKKQCLSTIGQTSLKLLEYYEAGKWGIPLAYRVFLHVGHIRVGHFWLAAE